MSSAVDVLETEAAGADAENADEKFAGEYDVHCGSSSTMRLCDTCDVEFEMKYMTNAGSRKSPTYRCNGKCTGAQGCCAAVRHLDRMTTDKSTKKAFQDLKRKDLYGYTENVKEAYQFVRE